MIEYSSHHGDRHALPTQQVHMEVVNRLPAIMAGVDNQPVPGLVHFFLGGNLAGDGEEMAENWFILGFYRIHRFDMLIRYDDDVMWGGRVDIVEGCDQIVLVDRVTGAISGNDPAEDTFRVHVSFQQSHLQGPSQKIL